MYPDWSLGLWLSHHNCVFYPNSGMLELTYSSSWEATVCTSSQLFVQWIKLVGQDGPCGSIYPQKLASANNQVFFFSWVSVGQHTIAPTLLSHCMVLRGWRFVLNRKWKEQKHLRNCISTLLSYWLYSNLIWWTIYPEQTSWWKLKAG